MFLPILLQHFFWDPMDPRPSTTILSSIRCLRLLAYHWAMNDSKPLKYHHSRLFQLSSEKKRLGDYTTELQFFFVFLCGSICFCAVSQVFFGDDFLGSPTSELFFWAPKKLLKGTARCRTVRKISLQRMMRRLKTSSCQRSVALEHKLSCT